MTPTDVRLWIDPSCPWAWQAFTWLRDVRDQGAIRLRYSLFSLEVNTLALERNDVDPGVPFRKAAATWGTSLEMLMLAGDEGGDDAFERLCVAIGHRAHDLDLDPTPTMLAGAAAEAGLPGLEARADADATLGQRVLASYVEARSLDVFGVPTLQIDDAAVIYGPILAVGPTGADGMALWHEVEGVARRAGFFELKRWPRTLRPGEVPTS
jgi:protein-disulfide isomerase-like protein with CxxC motif